MDKIFIEELAEQVANYCSTNHSILVEDEKEYEITVAFINYKLIGGGRTSRRLVPNKNTYEYIRATFYDFLELQEEEISEDGLPLLDWSIRISYFDELGIQHVLATIDFNPEGFLCKDGSHKKETFEEMLDDDEIEK